MLTIRSLLARPVVAPLSRPITTASGTIPSAPLVLIDLATNEGVTGRSYVFAYTPLMLGPLVGVFGKLGELLAGKPVAPADRYAEMERNFRLLGRQGLLGMAIGGIDMALWDALARSCDQPVAALLGGTCRPVPAYDSHGAFDAHRDTPAIGASLDRGFGAFKFKLGMGGLAQDVASLTEIRGAIGGDARLLVDYNQSLTPPEAIRRIREIGPRFDLDWVEEPVPAEDFAGHAAIRAAVDTPVQTGENWWFPEDAARALAAGICDHAMPDLMKIGGFTGWQRAAAMCSAASVPVSSHLFVEASAHALAATPGAFLLEYLDMAGAVLKNPYRVEAGALTPRGPGLDIDWDERAVSACLA